MLTASCHCGSIRIELTRRPTRLVRCTCSICRRYGALWARYSPKTARVIANPADETAYTWNDHVIEFYHCNRCGCMTRYEGVKKADNNRISVNTRMLPPDVIEGIRIRTFDGADSWKYID